MRNKSLKANIDFFRQNFDGPLTLENYRQFMNERLTDPVSDEDDNQLLLAQALEPPIGKAANCYIRRQQMVVLGGLSQGVSMVTVFFLLRKKAVFCKSPKVELQFTQVQVALLFSKSGLGGLEVL